MITNQKQILKVFFMHFCLCFLGLIFILQKISEKIGQCLFDKVSININLSAGYRLVIASSKLPSIFQYISLVVFCFIFFAILSVILLKKSVLWENAFYPKRLANRSGFYYHAVFILVLNLVLIGYLPDHLLMCLLALTAWLAITLLPFYHHIFQFIEKMGNFSSKHQRLAYMGLILLLVQMLMLFLPYISSKPLKVANDYWGIPEQSILNKHNIDNNAYMANHHIGTLTNPSELYLSQTSQKNIEGKNLPEILLCTHLSLQQCNQLLFNKSEFNLSQKKYTPEEIKFIQVNAYEFKFQQIAGHYFHHLNALFAPLNEYQLGKPMAHTIFLYGFGNSLLLVKIANYLCNFNFQTLEKVFYSIYPVYYGLLVILAAYIFRNIWWVLLATLLSFTALQLIGFEALRFAPGFNPLRHFLDIGVLAAFYQYLLSKRYSFLYLALSFVAALLAILANQEFGELLFMALSLVFLIHFRWVKRSLLELSLFILALAMALALAVWLKTHLGHNSLAIYALLGVSVAPTSPVIITLVSIFLILLYVFFTYFVLQKQHKKPWFYLGLLLFFYFQGALIYYIWYPELGHLLSINVAWVLLLVLITQKSLEYWGREAVNAGLIKAIVLAVFCFLYAPSLLLYCHGWYAYEKIFKTHKIYQWNFDRAQFLSTMNPEPFEESVTLMNRFSKGPVIYMISRFDNFLPFLAAKYNALPFVQLDLSLVTQKEFEQAVNVIRTDKPKYLFVDKDIGDDHFNDILNPQDLLAKSLAPEDEAYTLSLGRVLVLSHLAQFFAEVQSQYKPIAQGGLLTVYERNV